MDNLETGLPIEIHLETRVEQNNETEKHVFNEKGQIAQIGQTLYLRYKETNAEDGTQIPVTLKILPDGDVQLSRGATSSDTHLKLRFSQGNKVLARYRTPYGIIPVETITPRISVQMRSQPLSGEIFISYQLFAQGEHLGNYQIELFFTA